MAVDPGRIYSFGVFTYDDARMELRRNGYLIHLADQSNRILALLIEQAGVVVDREQIRERLWPKGEHVDFDHAISNAVRHLRLALRDNPRAPKYIATVSKRGYRFIAPLTLDAPAVSAAESSTPIQQAIPEALSEVSNLSDAQPPVSSSFFWQERRRLAWATAFLLPLLVLSGLLIKRSRATAPSPDIYMAIAPFRTDGANSELAESFRMELANAISVLPGVQVVAAHSLPSNTLSDADLKRLGEQMHIDVFVLGSLQENNRDCVLQLELVRAHDAVHLASFRYNGSVDDLETLRARAQGDIAQRRDLVRYATRPLPAPTVNPRAYESYLRGRYHLQQLTDQSLPQAVAEFNNAILLDPQFAKAYAGKADAYIAMSDHGILVAGKGYTMARELALNVVRMDPNSAEGHALLGFVYLVLDWRLEDAEKELRMAVRLDPSSARYHNWLAIVFCVQGRFDESYKEVDLAHAADPFWPPVYLTDAYIASAAHDRQRMYDSCQKLIKLRPDWGFAHHQYAWIAWYSGDSELAIHEWMHAAELDRDTKRVEFERAGLKALHSGGRQAYARLRLKAARENPSWALNQHEFAPAEWLYYSGDHDAAIQEIKASVDRRDSASIEFATNPVYDALRPDPRFQAQVARVVGEPAAGQIFRRTAGLHW